MTDVIKRQIEKIEQRQTLIREKIDKSESAEEVRALSEEWNGYNQELFDLRMALEDKPQDQTVIPPTTPQQRSLDSIGEAFTKRFAEKYAKPITGRMNFETELQTRASTDPIVTDGPSGNLYALLTTVDPNIVWQFRRPLITDVFHQVGISTQSVTYYIEGNMEGAPASAAEAGAKSQVHFITPQNVIEPVKKIAAFIKTSYEMLWDLPFYQSEVNQRLIYNLDLVEEQQLLFGNGTGSNLVGLCNSARNIQAYTVPAISTDEVDTEKVASLVAIANAEGIYHATTLIRTTVPFHADAVLVNPFDYENLRLAKNAMGSYYGKGFYYGNDGRPVEIEPPIWGLRTVVSLAVPQGSVIVGAFNNGATVYRRGGLFMDMTNSNVDDFESNLITTRAEKRLALAVRYPNAFVNVSLTTVADVTTITSDDSSDSSDSD